MIIDNNLIAYEYLKDRFTSNEIYPSGERDENKNIDKYSFVKKNYAILTLKDDIIDPKTGRGLAHGFYGVMADEYMDFLLLYQGDKLKAKIPVVKMEVLETNNPKQEKIKKMSAWRYKIEQERQYRKYMKGENPDDIEYKEANIYKNGEDNSYIIEYCSNNIILIGIIKF